MYKTTLEGLEGGSGKGYSKKESQQIAAKATLQRLKREPQFIDAVFTAKGNRTKMEEEPVLNVPDTEEKQDFIIAKAKDDTTSVAKETTNDKAAVMTEKVQKTSVAGDEFDLSDITATPKEPTREDIIAAAEAAAFSEEDC